MSEHRRKWSPRARLAVAVACSLLLHLGLWGVSLVAKRVAPTVIVKKGEPLFVELPRPEEFAPPAGPVRPVEPAPPSRPRGMRREPSALKPAPKADLRPAPHGATKALPEPTPPAPARPELPAVAKAAPATPEPDRLKPEQAPSPSPRAAAPPGPEPGGHRPDAEAPAKEKPPEAAPPPEEPGAGGRERQAALPPGLQREPGGEGGLRRGRGGIEGEPIPLDTKDPRYSEYFYKIRRQIRANWIYPREAGERGIGGQLVIEFVIAKDGHLEAIELRRSSGVEILDRFALNAVKLAQPFPRIPDTLTKVALPIAGIFTYQIVDPGLRNYFLR